MQQVFLKMVPDGVNPVIYATQNDDGRVFRFKLLNSDESDAYVLNGTETITAKIVKPDNTEITISITNPGIGKDYCDMVIGSDDCDLAGVYIGEASLLDYGRPLGSINFILKVEPDAYDGANVVVMDCGPADICTFETNLADNLVSLKVNITASGGNGTPSTPIPIVGHSALNLVRCGVNLWDEEWETGGFNADGTTNTRNDAFRTKNYIQVPPNTVLHIHQGNLADTDWCYPVFYDINKTPITRGVGYGTITMPSNAYYLRVQFNTAMGNTYSDNISINYPSTDIAYHAFNGQTFTVQFGQTVYGGVYDANRGKVRITHKYQRGGFSRISKDSSNKLWLCADLTDSKIYESTEAPNAISNMFVGKSLQNCRADNSGFTIFPRGLYIAGYVGNESALDDLLPNLEIAYELATPIEIDVSELSVDTIVRVNNVFGDTGKTELKYLKIEG